MVSGLRTQARETSSVRSLAQPQEVAVAVECEPKRVMGAVAAFMLHGTLLLVGTVVFAVVAVIHLWREWHFQRASIRK